MARPIKDGIDYFPFDVDFFADEKIEAIGGEFGIKGEIATIKLLCAIYRNGYYIKWNELIRSKLLRSLPGVTADLLESIVNRLVKWGFFDEPLFNSEKVLTSNGIQKRYLEATKRRKSELLLTYCIHKPPTNGVNVNINSQSKVKYSKVNESKVEGIGGEENSPPPPKVSLEQKREEAIKRRKSFGNELANYVSTYGKEQIRAFYDYWSELNKSGTKMRFEAETTWEIEKRLKRWMDKDFNKPNKQQTATDTGVPTTTL